MKFRLELLTVVTFPLHCFCLFENSGQDVAVPSEMEIPSNLCTIYEHFGAIDSFLRPKYEKLVLVIAEDFQDARTMAKYLSLDNRVHVESNKDRIPRQLQRDIVNILSLLYYNNESSTFIFAYPINVPNKVLADYLTRKIIESSGEISLVLTCPKIIKSDTLDRMFQVTASIILNYTANIFIPLSVIPFDSNKCKLLTIYNELEKYFLHTFKDFGDLSNPEVLINHIQLYPNIFTTKEKLIFHSVANLLTYKKSNHLEYFSCSEIKFPQTPRELFQILEFGTLNFNTSIHTDTTNFSCFGEKLFNLKTSSLSFARQTPMLTLSDVYSFLNLLESTYDNTFLLNDPNKRIQYICNSDNFKIIQQLCFLKYISNSQKLFLTFEDFIIRNLVTKIHWFQALLIIFENVDQWNKGTISTELENLFNEIPKTGDYDEQLMTKAFNIVKSNAFKREVEVTCSELELNTYKFQVKGTFLKLGDILKNHHCPGKIKFFEIFSLEKIIIDEDLVQIGEEAQVNIIAPIWEILLNRTINLDGAPGDNNWIHWKRSANLLGTDDYPGLPGQPGGTFFAVIGTANGGQNLKISTNGGRGGNGESGTYGEIRDNSEYMCFGNGGLGGIGGIHGVLKVFPLNNYATIDVQLSSNNGTIGAKGEGGYHSVYEARKVMNIRKNATNSNCLHESTVGPKYPKKSIIYENFDKSIKRYKKFLLTEMLKYKSKFYANVYIDLCNNNKIPNDYDMLILLDEMEILEKYYSFETNKTLTLHLLKAWNNKFREYFLHNLNTTENTIHTKVFLSLDSMFTRKIQKLENKFYDNSILVIETYLDACIQDTKKLKNVEILVDMKTITQRYTAEFEEEIKNANQLLSSELKIYLSNTIDDLNTSIQQIVIEIDQMIEMKKVENKKLEDMRIKMQMKMALSIFFGILQFLFLALSFINPAFAIVGTALYAGSSALESAFDSPDDDSFLLNSEFQTSITSMRGNYQQLRKLQTSKKIPSRTPKHSANIRSDAVSSGKEAMNKLANYNSATNEIDSSINQNLEDIRKLEDYKTMVYEQLMPTIEELNKQITTKTSQFYNSSLMNLEFEKWRMDDYLSDIGKQLDKWTQTFNVDTNAVEKLKKAIDTTIRVHTLIKEMNYKIKGAQFLTNIAKVPYQHYQTNIQDEDLKNRVTNLMHIHYANDIIDEYKKWKIAFKQYTFPFVKEYPDITELQTSTIADPLTRANLIVEKMNYLRPYLSKKKAEAQFFTTMATFGNDEQLCPFYIWKNSKHSIDIQEILRGKTVSLYADINDFPKLNAVKFRDINIMFTSSNATLNEELRNDLSSFSVKMIHNGDSRYRCNNRVQTFQSGVYNFGIKFFKSRRKRFSGHGKLDYVLSPFATWTISLWNNLGKGDFNLLSKYVGKVNMELIGDGEFLNPGINCSQL